MVQLQNRRYLTWPALGTVSMALVMAVLLVLQLTQRQAILAGNNLQADMVSTLVFQFEREFLRFRQTLDSSINSRTPPDADALSLRYDIFISRLNLLRDNPSTGDLLQLPAYQDTLPKVDTLIASTDQALVQTPLEKATLVALLDGYNALGPDVQALSLSANSLIAKTVERQKAALLSQNNQILTLTAVQLALLLLAAASLMLWQRRQLRERLALEELSESLRQAKRATDNANRQIEERNEQLNAIFELSPDGFVSFDAHKRVKYISPAFTQLTGQGAQQLAGLCEHDFSVWLAQRCAPGTPFVGVAALRDQALHGGAEKRELIELALPTKRVLQVGLRSNTTGQVSQILYLRDVTVETEVDHMKSEFLATAAHELRTPMASIFGFSEILLHEKFDEPTQQEFLNTIYEQSRLMADILNELLDLARIEARRDKDFRYTQVNLQELLCDLIKGYQLPSGRNAPELDLPLSPLYLMADAGKLRQALLNVISNAYKYSPQGGAVHVKAAVEDAVGQAPRVNISVTDHGIGLTAEQLKRVCERFYRADTSGKILGTGLGMSIVKEIIELHRGQLSLTSTPGQGTSVCLCLPTYSTLQDGFAANPLLRRVTDTRPADLN
ncbi:MAG: ATP-binding protein [Rhodoferax sp.]|uniref:ATP-binding protein n=1 Tax=Rhodoferax sp. TaxID=50421 RepID=UPI00261F15B0|nr:ATP-binding protein [Rhodoferax sp.]MDD2881840.1 ATP-binding protein [Rhodoferax sp.]